MRNFLLLLLLALVLIFLFSLKIKEKVYLKKFLLQEPELVIPALQKPKFPDRVGERITYDVMLGGMRMGKAVFYYQSKTEFGSKQVNLFTFETKLMRFKDNEKIYGDPETFLPLRVEREISSWPKYEKIIELYDQEKFSLNIIKAENGKNYEQNFKKDSAIHNAVILPYMIRRIPELAVGWNFEANLPTQKFKIELSGIEDLKLPSGVFKAYYFKSTPERFEIWISADERKIPLKIRGMSGIGYTLVMREYYWEK